MMKFIDNHFIYYHNHFILSICKNWQKSRYQRSKNDN